MVDKEAMMLSEEQVKEQLEILDRTNMHKNAAI